MPDYKLDVYGFYELDDGITTDLIEMDSKKPGISTYWAFCLLFFGCLSLKIAWLWWV
jgi:hypothetical protein